MSSEDMGRLFDLEASGYFYTRLQNPTNDYVAAKIAELEGGTAAMLTSSGQAANFFALFNICSCGDHIVASSSIYGGTFNLISVTMAKMGIETFPLTRPTKSWMPPSGTIPRLFSVKPLPILPLPFWISKNSPPPPTVTECL